MPRLTIQDHSRDSSGMTYVYPVVSRRAGGVSVGINLNPNNACNWRCIYCQVPDLQRGGPPPIDLELLETELQDLLAQLYRGDFLERHAPPEARQVVDIAFSGNGEPTSAAEFADAVALVGRIVDGFSLMSPPAVRLITNGSLLDREAVQRGIGLLATRQGEVWFKVDAVGADAMKRINDVAYEPELVIKRLHRCCALCPTWVQTCWFACDGLPPNHDDIDRYIDMLIQAREGLSGVFLYGIARPSMQAEAPRLNALPATWLEERANLIRRRTGLTVKVSP